MYRLFRSILFLFDPETIHNWAIMFLRVAGKMPITSFLTKKCHTVKGPSLQKEVFGITFPNPVGFAAGFDKNAEVYNSLANYGFGFIEIGTVTPKAQQGNPRPRSFRLKEDKALINRMGFNNHGIEEVVARLRKGEKNIIIGGNIGKNTNTSNSDAVLDYVKCFKALYDYVDYFTVNVSCPNIGNLQKLQEKNELETILKDIVAERKYQDVYKPILLKISPDLQPEQVDDAIYIVREIGIDGIVASNTTTSRKGLTSSEFKIAEIGNGGLSGAPLTKRTLETVKYISEQTSGQLPIIAVGGIMTPQDAKDLLDAGASLVQIYTGFIYNGPGFVKKILKYIK